MTSLEDPCKQIVTLCNLWWDTRDIKKNQAMFQNGGKYYTRDSFNVMNWWKYELREFLNTPFTYLENNNELQFTPISLDESLRVRLIAQLGCGIGLFYRDFLSVAKKLPELN